MDIVSTYLDLQLKKTGATFKGFSPWTMEKTPSFFVHPGKNIYKDFSSGKGGNNAISFVMDKEGVEFVEAVKVLATRANVIIEYTTPLSTLSHENGHDRKEIKEALQWALAHFCANEIPETFSKGRNFPDAILDAFKIGYSKFSWSDLTEAAIKAGFNSDVLVRAGLIRERESDGFYDYFRDRIMFPILDERGDVIAFTGRDAESDFKLGKDQDNDESQRPPKYLNSPDTAYSKGKNLFGLFQAITSKKIDRGIYLVEGPTDTLRMYQHGRENTVAPCGSTLTDEQAKLIGKYTDKLIIVPDNDCSKKVNAGLSALERNALVAIKAGLKVSVLIPGEFK